MPTKRRKLQFEFSELIQAVSNCEPKGIKDSLKIYMYVLKLFNPNISARTIRYTHPTLQKANHMHRKLRENCSLLKEYNKLDLLWSCQLMPMLVMIQ